MTGVQTCALPIFFACQGSGQAKTRSLLAERPGQELAWPPGRAHPLLLGHGVIRAFLVRGRGVFHLRGFVAVGGRLVFQESLPVGAGRRKFADGLEIATPELRRIGRIAEGTVNLRPGILVLPHAVGFVARHGVHEFPHHFPVGRHFEHVTVVGGRDLPVTVGELLRRALVIGIEAVRVLGLERPDDLAAVEGAVAFYLIDGAVVAAGTLSDRKSVV